MFLPRAALVLPALLALACGRDGKAPAADSPAAVSASAAAADSTLMAPIAPGAACPDVAPWRPCSVEDRIARAGLAVNRRPDGVHHDFMHVDGLVWETSRAEIQVFLYPSEEERRRDTDQLDTVFVSPRGRRIYWKQPATLVTSQNLAAIILSPNPRQTERIALALGAGLPVSRQ